MDSTGREYEVIIFDDSLPSGALHCHVLEWIITRNYNLHLHPGVLPRVGGRYLPRCHVAPHLQSIEWMGFDTCEQIRVQTISRIVQYNIPYCTCTSSSAGSQRPACAAAWMSATSLAMSAVLTRSLMNLPSRCFWTRLQSSLHQPRALCQITLLYYPVRSNNHKNMTNRLSGIMY